MNAAPNVFGPAGGTGSGGAAHGEIGLARRASGACEDFA